MIKNGKKILSTKTEEVILVYGNKESQTVEDIITSH